MRTRASRPTIGAAAALAALALLVSGCTSAPTAQEPPGRSPSSPTAAGSPEPSVLPTASPVPSPSTPGPSPSTPGPSPLTPGPTSQAPWTLSLDATSCALWLGEMFPAQRLAAAGQMLAASRVADDRPGQPADELVTAFEADVTTQCGGDGNLTVQKAADAVYEGAGHGRYSG